ncbi:hypothetical protein RCO28_12735 [Streptomyces sp. LHD-70]|uniref:hypothetical protein n=1 Tax=Streptomyces sp. LHD-70 TaxID=3072140 RepID=UPI00280E3DAB|nr:hypothetical protein [Streptomyces sp. LHD-70]MDQ8703346.1 hypothetical protein [Streptomyces sp. LHD-70]
MSSVRVGTAFLAAAQLLVGGWILLVPKSFWDVPWVSVVPPYNEHLLFDHGAQYLSLAVILGAAAWWTERRLTMVALVALLAFTVPHLAFHAAHLAPLSTASAAGLMFTLGMGVLLPVALLVAVGRSAPHRD